MEMKNKQEAKHSKTISMLQKIRDMEDLTQLRGVSTVQNSTSQVKIFESHEKLVDSHASLANEAHGEDKPVAFTGPTD